MRLDDIERTITQLNSRATRVCWLPSEERGPSSSLRVVAQIEVAPDGRVSDVQIGHMPARYPRLRWCIGDLLWKLRLPPSPKPMFVTVALQLEAP